MCLAPGGRGSGCKHECGEQPDSEETTGVDLRPQGSAENTSRTGGLLPRLVMIQRIDKVHTATQDF